ncbi:hypothetical protein [Stutzerimonas stutzeri]|uniref:hypothetical protein n=1 Tax=Stutzerimonas stutzeri TaxID=316 RepID=UPI001268B557|nr:hypothetical protein [Stutzerimonas stutzeri]
MNTHQKKSNFKQEIKMISAKLPNEILVGLLLGGIPAIANSGTRESFRKIFDALLTSEPLIAWYGILLLVLLSLTIFKWKFRFMSNLAQSIMIHMLKVAAEVGTSFLTALRTGLGAMLGFMIIWHTAEPETLTIGNWIGLLILFASTLFMTGVVSLLHDAIQHVNRPRVFESIKMNIN